MKFLVLTTITEPLKVGDVIHTDPKFLGSHFFKVISREGSEMILYSCAESGILTPGIKTFTIRDRKTIGSLVWKKVGFTTIPPRG